MYFEDQRIYAAALLQIKVIFSKSFLTGTKKERLYQERKFDYIEERKILHGGVVFDLFSILFTDILENGL